MRNLFILLGAAALAACGQSNEGAATNQVVAKAPPKKKPAYCFFKESEAKAWAAARDKDGNIVVKGKAYRADPRYQAVLGPPIVTGATAEIAPTIQQNATGYAAPDNWWDVTATIPNSTTVDTVKISCGAKTFAELKVAATG